MSEGMKCHIPLGWEGGRKPELRMPRARGTWQEAYKKSIKTSVPSQGTARVPLAGCLPLLSFLLQSGELPAPSPEQEPQQHP